MAKGFKSPKMQNPMSMMGSLQKLQEQIQQMQEQLADEVVTASAGGGVVKVTMTGDQHCRGIQLDPQILQDADVEMLQDLVLTAVNNALDASRQLAADRMAPLTGGLGLPF
jgi:DNA-binding YbaB/EbfC family protein